MTLVVVYLNGIIYRLESDDPAVPVWLLATAEKIEPEIEWRFWESQSLPDHPDLRWPR